MSPSPTNWSAATSRGEYRGPFQATTIGGRELVVIAGPCAIESREQAFAIAERVARAGAQFFRGGAFKPRTSPYAFQGLGGSAGDPGRGPRAVSGCASSPRPSTPSLSWSPVCATSSRSARATCRTSRCSSAPDGSQAGPAQARHVGHARRVSDGRRVHHERGQLQR